MILAGPEKWWKIKEHKNYQFYSNRFKEALICCEKTEWNFAENIFIKWQKYQEKCRSSNLFS